MPLAFPGSRNRRMGPGGGPLSSSGGAGAAVGFGAVAAAAAFAVAVQRAARSRSPVGTSDLISAIAEDGTVPEFEALLQQIAEKGLEPAVRPEVWPLLLGVYGADETQENRAASYKMLRESFESLLRRCQELETACLEATSCRRSTRPSSSCGAPKQSTSTATSATASPLYSKSPANAGSSCRPLSAAAAAAGAAAAASGVGDGRCDLPSLANPIHDIPASQLGDGSWGTAAATGAAAAAAATAAAVAAVEWEDEGSGGGAFPAPSEASFLGHVSRTDVPLALRPYWEAQQSIALDAVRVDFKKSMLPGATPLAAAGSGSGGGGAVGGLTLSLRGLGFTGLGSGGGAAAAAVGTPAASALSPAASAPAPAGPGGDGGGAAAAAAGAPATAGSGRLSSWFREKYEGYRAARQQQQQQQERDQQQLQQMQDGQLGEQPQQQELQEFQRASSGASPQSLRLMDEQQAAQGSAAMAEAVRTQGPLGQGKEEQGPLGQGPQAPGKEGLEESAVAEAECPELERSFEGLPAAACGDAMAGQRPPSDGGSCGGGDDTTAPVHCISSSACGDLDCGPGGAAVTAADASQCGLLPVTVPLPSPDGGAAALLAGRSKPSLSSAFAAAAASVFASNAAASAADEPACGGSTSGASAVVQPPASSPASVAAYPGEVRSATGDPRVGDAGDGDGGPSPATARSTSSFFSFAARMRQLASAPALASAAPPCPAASCPASPLMLQGTGALASNSNGCQRQMGPAQDCPPGTASASSVSGLSSTPRHTSEGGASRSFTQARDAAVAEATAAEAAAAAAAASAAAAGGGGGGLPPCVSALARFQLEHAAHFSPGQMRLVERLVSLLSAYSAHDPGLGYCQGMSDLALPFVLLLEDDVMAFWCFVRLMGKVRANFMPGPDGAFERLATLGSLLARLDEQVGAHLAALHAGNCHFAHRMVAAQMRRELAPELAVRVWEQLWADDLLEDMAAAAAVARERGRDRAAAGGVELRELSGARAVVWRQRDGGGGRGGAAGEGEGSGGVAAAAAETGDAEGAFGNGGASAASAALTAAAAAEDHDACEPETAASCGGGVALSCCAPAEPSMPDGADTGAAATDLASARGSGGAAVTHGSCDVIAATHGSLQGRPAAASYSEGVTSLIGPPAGAADASALAMALSCETAAAAAAKEVAAATAAAAEQDADGSICVTTHYHTDSTTDLTAAAVTKAAAGGGAAAAAGEASAVVSSTVPLCSPPVLGRDLFLYLVAAVVLSQRRRLLECRELDDVLRLFQSLPPLSRSDVSDALRNAREYRDRVAPRPPAPAPPLPAAAVNGGRSGSCVSAAAASPPERIWRLLSLRSEPPAAKL